MDVATIGERRNPEAARLIREYERIRNAGFKKKLRRQLARHRGKWVNTRIVTV